MKTPYTQTSASPPTPSGINVNLAKDEPSRLWFWSALAVIVHAVLIVVVWLGIVILQFLGWNIPLLDLSVKQRDVEFVLVDNSPKAPPKKPTRLRAEHASRSGGQKIANRPTQVAQQAAGNPAPKKAASQPASRPQPKPRPQPQPSRQSAQQSPAPRPTPKPSPQPVTQAQAPTPKPAPTPPAPKIPNRTKVADASPALPPNPIAPTIRTPAPKNPSASAGGPIVKTPGGGTSGGSAGGGSSGSGSPGPSMIAGNPSRSGGGSPGGAGRPGGGGSGGRGSYNQSGSPGGGGGRPGIDAEAEPDFGPYISELQRRIKRNWAPPTEDRNKRVVVVFRISRDGRLLSVQMKASSGSPTADQAAIAAVRLSAPFKQLPPGYKGSDIPVEFTFDYQVFGGRTR